jgi:hypothetical protein
MFIPNSASSIARIIGLTHIDIVLWFLREDHPCNPGYSKTHVPVSYLKIVILLPQILCMVMTSLCSISALVKSWPGFVSHTQFYTVLEVFGRNFGLILSSFLLGKYSTTWVSPPALHVDIKWFLSWALSVVYWYDSMAFLEMFPWRYRTHSSFVFDIYHCR